MNRAEWYVVLRKGGLSSLTDIEGVRLMDKDVMGGAIVPGLWFRDVPDADFESIFISGYHAIQAYSPSAEELPILYTLYPAMMPKSVKMPGNSAARLQNKWFKVASHKQMVYGVAALCTVQGVCKAGDVALAGDIVPGQWFAGLTIDQLNLMERCGARSAIWFDAQAPEYRARSGHKAPIERYPANPIETLSLYEKFPGANPKAKIASAESAEELTEGGE